MTTKLLYLFTRTPLHVGAGSSVGAIDQPIVRERHTGFPIIPASSLKGSFADQWNDTLGQPDNNGRRWRESGEAAWLFGSDDAKEEKAAAGALLFGEARLLAFPIRSAKGSYAWITSPTILRRAARDGVINESDIPAFPDDNERDGQALFLRFGPLTLPNDKVVLEEYAFSHSAGDETKLKAVGDALQKLLPSDPVWSEVASRLVILSDGQMSFFATTACEVAQHVRINDKTGTAAQGGLFNQENVPAETLFYGVVHATKGRSAAHRDRTPAAALDALATRLTEERSTLQIGGDASTGLGYCTAVLSKPTAKA